MDWRERKHLTSTLVAVAGCKAVTFRAWRNRNGLFPETQEASGWNRFSVIDICVARAVVVMTEHGFPADEAVKEADKWYRLYFSDLLSGSDVFRWQGYVKGGLAENDEPTTYVDTETGVVSTERPAHWTGKVASSFMSIGSDQTVADLMSRTKGLITVIDLRSIVAHVVAELVALAPETVATRDETYKAVFSTFAQAILPKPSDEEDAE